MTEQAANPYAQEAELALKFVVLPKNIKLRFFMDGVLLKFQHEHELRVRQIHELQKAMEVAFRNGANSEQIMQRAFHISEVGCFVKDLPLLLDSYLPHFSVSPHQ